MASSRRSPRPGYVCRHRQQRRRRSDGHLRLLVFANFSSWQPAPDRLYLCLGKALRMRGSYLRFVGTIWISVAAASLVIACSASVQQVREELGARYVGQSIDQLVRDFGPPVNAFKMHSGDTSYLWQLSAITDIAVNDGVGSAATSHCKLNVIASPSGTVTRLTTEDQNRIEGGVIGIVTGVGVGSICAKRLGIAHKSRS